MGLTPLNRAHQYFSESNKPAHHRPELELVANEKFMTLDDDQKAPEQQQVVMQNGACPCCGRTNSILNSDDMVIVLLALIFVWLCLSSRK